MVAEVRVGAPQSHADEVGALVDRRGRGPLGAGPVTSPQAAWSSGEHSSGGVSMISTAMAGRFGIAPSKLRNGRAVSPPTVTVEPRVPPA